MNTHTGKTIMFSFVLIRLFISSTESLIEDEVCYSPLGCFSTQPPFHASPERPFTTTPQSPDKIRTVFKLYTRKNRTTPINLDAIQIDNVSTLWSDFRARPVKFIVHGFNTGPSLSAWMMEMKEELLLFADYNVILVNWSKGSKAVYHQAVANIRVVGAQLAHLINTMIESFRMNASDFHIIGHSLGSHTAGYAGERVAGLGRISGLDPAGPMFENTDTRVCLDSSDAMFVDVIHTNGKPLILLGFGTLQPLGHFDFYPNLGRDMPGCIQDEILDLIEEGIPAGLSESVTCSHSRATAYYIESINSKCPYTAYPCDNEEDFKCGKCKSCATHRCVRMGFHAKPRDGRNQKYYLITSDEKQYCRRGHILVNATGTLGYSPSTKVSPKSRCFRNNQTITFTLTSPSDIGEILSVSLHFDVGRLDSVLGKLLQRSFPRIYINRVVIYRTESNQNVTFCAGDQPIEDHQSVTMDRQYDVADEVC